MAQLRAQIKFWPVFAGCRYGLRGFPMSERIGDPVIEQPLFLERQDGEEKLFVDILELLAPPDSLRVERLWNECLKLPWGVHFEVTSCVSPL
ncbi:MAG TPA: hypothetical protein VFR68_09580 [Candidatus Dormibacteraeota bacterium]|nr:hypothetical protein [Candidatus Dormibacteraeota bacterium]